MPLSISVTLLACIAIAGIATVVKDRIDEARKRKASEAAYYRWKGRRRELDRWLAQESHRSVESPEGQRLLSLEVGAYMVYLGTKDYPSPGEERYLQERSALLSSDVSTWRPAL